MDITVGRKGSIPFMSTNQQKKHKMKNFKTMSEKENLIEGKTQIIKTQEMLAELLEKWSDKDYYLTNEEWSTIKSWKTFLDSIFNDVKTLKDLIELNKSDLKELTK